MANAALRVPCEGKPHIMLYQSPHGGSAGWIQCVGICPYEHQEKAAEFVDKLNKRLNGRFFMDNDNGRQTN